MTTTTQESRLPERERNRRADQSRLAVSRNEAARQLDVSLDTIDRMIGRGELEKIKVSTRKVAVTMRSLLRLLPEEAA